MNESQIMFGIEQTCDLKHWVVQINTTGEDDGWFDITKDFNNYEEALEWAKSLKGRFHVFTQRGEVDG